MNTLRRLSALPLLSLLAALALCAAPTYAQPAAPSKTATTTTLKVDPACLAEGCVTTLTATVVAGTAPVHPGLVFFCEGTLPDCEYGVTLGHAQIAANGTATTRTTLSLGGHQIHAIFEGTKLFNVSASATESLTVLQAPIKATTTYDFFNSSGPQSPAFPTYTFGAGVTSIGAPAPTGTVLLVDQTKGNAVLESTQLPTPASTAPTYFRYDTGQLDFSQIPASTVQGVTYTANGDFNNDGFQDIVLISSTGLHVLLGSAHGRFTLAPFTSNTLGTPSQLLVGDFNSDGKLDIAIADAVTNTVHVSLGNGDGTFTDAKPTSLNFNPGTLYLGDFNNDGFPDLVSASLSGLQPLLGKGDGTFSVNSSAFIANGGGPLAVADFNLDGNQDIAVNGTLLLGAGNGTFKPFATAFLALSPIAIGDFNGDGIPDLFGEQGDGLLYLLEGNGDGTYNEIFRGSLRRGLQTYTFGPAIYVGDFNHDGLLDYAAAEYGTGQNKYDSPNFFVYLNLGPPNYGLTPVTATPLSGSTLTTGADFNSDGFPDVVFFNSSGVNPDGAQGITAYTGTDSYTAVSSDVTFSPIGLRPGLHTLVASYAGDNEHTGSVSAPTSVEGAQVADYSTGFANAAGLTFNGGASVHNGAIGLTDGKRFESHSVFTTSRIPVGAFDTTFEFQIPSGNADGLAFVVQSNGPNAIGSSGGGIGYGFAPGATTGPSITNSFALIFDLHNNQGEGANSVRVENGGITSPEGAIDLTPYGIDLHSGHRFSARLFFSNLNSLLNLKLTDLDTQAIASVALFASLGGPESNPHLLGSVSGDLAYVGFTSATGATPSTVNIANWRYSGIGCCNANGQAGSGPSEILPLFGNGFASAAGSLLLNKGAAIHGSALELTNGTPFEATSAYFTPHVSPIDSNYTFSPTFVTDFDFVIEGTGGDGFTFVIQGQGPTAVGSIGGGLGYGPENPAYTKEAGIGSSFAVKFDLHNNDGEGPNSTGFYVNGASPTAPAIDLYSSGINLHSGHNFHAHLVNGGDGTLLTLTDLTEYHVFTQLTKSSLPQVLPSSGLAGPTYLGFTAGTGATANTIKILNWTYLNY